MGWTTGVGARVPGRRDVRLAKLGFAGIGTVRSARGRPKKTFFAGSVRFGVPAPFLGASAREKRVRSQVRTHLQSRLTIHA